MIDLPPAPTVHQEPRHMLIVDCPLCDAPAPYDAIAGTLECPACAVRLDTAVENDAAELAAAA